MDPAVEILAKAMYEAVDAEDARKEELSKTLQGNFNEFDLRPHFDDMSPTEKAACSDRAENLAEAHTESGGMPKEVIRPDVESRPMVDNAPSGTGMNWGEEIGKL
jgi:hypothetical protein